MKINGAGMNSIELAGAAAETTAPVGVWYRYDLPPKTDFADFQSFLAAPNGPRIDADLPANTDVRVANRFAAAAADVYNLGGSADPWLAFGGDPNVLPAVAAWNAMPSGNWLKTGGFVATAPYFGISLFLRTGAAAAAPAVTLARIAYNRGSQAVVVAVLNLVNAVAVGATTLPAGLYLFDTIEGYRLEDGNYDIDQPIAKSFTTQRVAAADATPIIWRRVEVEIAAAAAATVRVTPIIDGAAAAARDLAVTVGDRVYQAGIEHGAPGMEIQARLEWTDPGVAVRLVNFVAEPSGLAAA